MFEATLNVKPKKSFNLTSQGGGTGGGTPTTESGEEPGYLKEQKSLVNAYFETQRQGRSGAVGEYYCQPEQAEHLFAVQSWEIVSQVCTEDKGFFKVRVDSTNKGGTKITHIWTVATMRNYSLKYCIRVVYKAE